MYTDLIHHGIAFYNPHRTANSNMFIHITSDYNEVTDGRKVFVPDIELDHLTLGTPVRCSTN